MSHASSGTKRPYRPPYYGPALPLSKDFQPKLTLKFLESRIMDLENAVEALQYAIMPAEEMEDDECTEDERDVPDALEDKKE